MAATSRCIARFFIAKDAGLIEVLNLGANGVEGEVVLVVQTDTRHSSTRAQLPASCQSISSASTYQFAHAQIQVSGAQN